MKIKGFDKFIAYHFISSRLPAVDNYLSALEAYLRKPDETRRFVVNTAQSLVHQKLAEATVHNPDFGQWAQFGFAPCLRTTSMDAPKNDDADEAFDPLKFVKTIDPENEMPLIRPLESGKGFIMCIETRERVLPGAAIDEAHRQRCEKWKETEGMYPNRKQRAEIKEDVVDSMLKRAPIRPSNVYIMVTRAMIYVFTSSPTKAEEHLGLLRKVFETLPVAQAAADKLTIAEALQTVITAPSVTLRPDDYVKWTQAGEAKEEHTDKIQIQQSDLADQMDTQTNVVELALQAWQLNKPNDEDDVPSVAFRFKQTGVVSALNIIGAAGAFNAGPVELEMLQTNIGIILENLAAFNMLKSRESLLITMDEPENDPELDPDDDDVFKDAWLTVHEEDETEDDEL